jgi:predicted metal-dependent hydrolase
VALFNINKLIEGSLGAKMGAKALQNRKNSKSEALLRAQKADNALKTYPFADISPDIALKINPRAKRMALRLDPKKRVVNLVVPKRGSMRDAYMFALEHKHWIREKIAELPKQILFTDGAVIPLLGQERTINITYINTLKKTDISLKDNELSVFTNKKDASVRIKRFIIKLAKDELTKLSYKKAYSICKKVASVDVKDTTSRWGSCAEDGCLNYSWRLIFAPYNAFDYVVAHEVAHLCHMDHSPAFWHVCEDLSADYSGGKSWMKRHSGDLIRYG